jgi:hypothetical protein
VVAHQREDGIQPQLRSAPHEQFSSVWHRIAMLLQSNLDPSKNPGHRRSRLYRLPHGPATDA